MHGLFEQVYLTTRR
jgi:hypothetical protein